MAIERFEDIEGWQLGRELSVRIYGHTGTGDFARNFGLRDQIQRASGSIMHNIAEGFDSGSNPEFIRFLGYSHRSCSEVQSQLYVAFDLAYIDETAFQNLYGLAARARSKIGAFIRYLRDHPRPESGPNPELRTPNPERPLPS